MPQVTSPCCGICELDPDSGLCTGCYRTLDEIACWCMADEAVRRAIREAADQRRQTAGDAAR
ncbi:MAG: DUF1289 domain-containing protein [Proteobacteria bacterium]|nr:DUF1289 domain-containing protein [Pseudomonadota bacterium]HQR04127.1 DUF1289 domain-containing protein [Rhodocyclaceae bacterium]